MGMKFTELCCKEVICVRDGRRLGFVADIQVSLPDGQVSAIVVPGKARLFGVLGCREDYIVPWNAIRRIGPDIVLVDIQPESCCCPRSKFRAFPGKN